MSCFQSRSASVRAKALPLRFGEDEGDGESRLHLSGHLIDDDLLLLPLRFGESKGNRENKHKGALSEVRSNVANE